MKTSSTLNSKLLAEFQVFCLNFDTFNLKQNLSCIRLPQYLKRFERELRNVLKCFVARGVDGKNTEFQEV